jgi:AraC family transcriptional regulator, melibiose operon regulatory protein
MPGGELLAKPWIIRLARACRSVWRDGLDQCMGDRLKPGHRSEGGSPALRGGDNVDRIRRTLCFIAQNYTERINAELISQAAGFHPNYAMNLFRKTPGTTLVNHVTRHRVSHARRLLATTDQKVIEVSLNSGFNSANRFQ